MEIIPSIITILLCGALTFFGIYGIIRVFLCVWREERSLSFLLMIVFILFVISIPTISLYVEIDNLFGKPRPSNIKEMTVGALKLVEYQDVTHYCDAEKRDSSCFTTVMMAGGKTSKDDGCIKCGKKFKDHRTRLEQWLYDFALSDLDNISYYFY